MLPFADDDTHRLLLVMIGKTLRLGIEPYQATRGVWRVDVNKARLAALVLGISDGVVVSVFRPVRWKPATREEFPHHHENRTVPERLAWRRGAANPVRYSW